MSNPNAFCINEMMVNNIVQETDDVYTLELIAQDFYPYEPGQYALVSIKNTPDIARAYTLSSTPGLSRYVTLTVRRIENGVGSTWLTQDVKVGDTLWLSDPKGDFTCSKIVSDNYLLVAGGCGITPIMSMVRWLCVNRPQANLTVFYSVHSPKDVIFKREWEQLKAQYPHLRLYMNSSQGASEGFYAGRISQQMLQELVPHIADCTVLTCGPESYMQHIRDITEQLGVPKERFFLEQFHSSTEVCMTDNSKQVGLTVYGIIGEQTVSVPFGISLLSALEENNIPVIAACRTGICGSCKTKVLQGEYETSTTGPLTPQEIEQGYVLACRCQIKGNMQVEPVI
ncbi:NADH oxidoreductase [Testudinibacter aquarius]|uniref:NADH oxidoreductase n=1 Tax=Testudinibacter aquarius TaxID=1524974 RepID=A0A4R3YGW7_9PAST|nr:NADH oxidoreductase [Testudinibacter aquarius]KAE9529433.1 NADH oxidoreductase [Testudinibacter aquarius]TCV89813.1 NADH oxidoreductase Hcr [Testudinibacter aquarius]TNG93073.1 NADH oxidoreductase [Testudinibacter aquarius]